MSAVVLGLMAGCDTDISGETFRNEPPDTELSVRDESLLDNLEEDDRLVSTVKVSWVGDDVDGFVQGYEIRYFDLELDPAPATEWTFTESTDSTLLLPIRQGERTSNVVFEVRAVDDQDARDPTPARTVFPVKNSPPTLRISPFDLPPDTTFNVISFGLVAEDPDGEENLSRIDVSFNDSLNFTPLPGNTEFVTFVAPQTDPGQGVSEVSARVFLGRGFESTPIEVPGINVNETNTFYARSADRTDTTSTVQSFEWFVKAKTATVLYVNDYRRETTPTVTDYHFSLLREYVGSDTPIDYWDITRPFTTGSSGNVPRSVFLPPSATPTLSTFLAEYEYIYWVSSTTTNGIQGNNLPFAAAVMDQFFDEGGKIMVHTPISLPSDREQIAQNAAILMMPLTDLVQFPDSLRPSLRLPGGTAVQAVSGLPSVSESLPELQMNAFLINTLPFVAGGTNIVPLYEADYQYVTRSGGRGSWFGSNVVASISTDQRVGLFVLPLVNDATGDPILVDTNGNPEASRTAVKLMLESLGFPN